MTILPIPEFRQPIVTRSGSAQQARLRLLNTLGRDRSGLPPRNQSTAPSNAADAALLNTLLDTQLGAERTRRS